MQILSLSDKRLIIEVIVNNKKATFLVDTGASVGLIDEGVATMYNLLAGRKFNTPLIGTGGVVSSSYVCNTVVTIGTKQMNLFILSNISDIQDSIKKETDINIVGIIGLPLMKFIGMKIDTLTNTILI